MSDKKVIDLSSYALKKEMRKNMNSGKKVLYIDDYNKNILGNCFERNDDEDFKTRMSNIKDSLEKIDFLMRALQAKEDFEKK